MARDYDFYSPFFSAAIITSDNVRVPLWTNVVGGQDSAAVKDFSKDESVANGLVSFPFLESLTIEMGLGMFPRMTAVLTPPLRDSQKFLDSTLVENGKATLEAIIGYSSGTSSGPVLSAPFQALILEPDISLGVDSTITLNALGVAGYDASTTQTSRSFNNQTRRAILDELSGGPKVSTPEAAPESLVENHGGILGSVSEIQPEVKLSQAPPASKVRRNLYMDFSTIKPGSDEDNALNQKVVVAQGWKTDWMFMLQIANEAGCWLVMSVKREGDQEKNFVQVMATGAHLADRPKYTLRFYDYVQGVLGPTHENINDAKTKVTSEGDFPILSVSTQSKQVWLPGSTKALVATGIDSRTGRTISKVWSDWNASPSDVTGGGGTTPAPDGNNTSVSKDGTGGAPATKSDPGVTVGDQVNKSRFATDFSMGIALRVLTLGIPDILPGNVVAVRGVGNRFDFNYGVFTVRHTLGPSGYTTELELVSNTSALLGSVKQAQGSINDQATASKEVVAEIPTVPEDHGGILGNVADLNPSR